MLIWISDRNYVNCYHEQKNNNTHMDIFHLPNWLSFRYVLNKKRFYIINLIAGLSFCAQDLKVRNCSHTEYCDLDTNRCQCMTGFKRLNDTFCIPATTPENNSIPNRSRLIENENDGSVTAYVITPIVLLVFVVCGIYINRRYHIVTWVKNRMHRNTEQRDELMIGHDLDDEDDDPPLH